MEPEDRARRWQLVLPHRDRLLRLARGLVADPGDAEACVQEALTRCVTFADLDEANVAGFLVTTTRRLCADHHRGHAHAVRVSAKLTARLRDEAGPDEVVCDRAEAAWMSERLSDLPGRQRDVVLARAAGHSPQEIAERLAVSYKTVETLLYRVRVRARAELERAYAGIAVAFGRWSRTDLSAVGATTSLAVAVGAAMFVAPPVAPPREVALPEPGRMTVVRPLPRATTPAPVPLPAPSPTPYPTVTATSVRLPDVPARPTPTLSPCDYPPYFADPCVSPNPSRPPGIALLDCLRYGLEPRSGRGICRTEPPREPRHLSQEGDS